MMSPEKVLRLYRFDTCGPFAVPVKSNQIIDCPALKLFWADVEKAHRSLGKAMGCYIFAIRSEVEELPWYVGKSEKQDFASEAFQPHKILHYQDALEVAKEGIPILYLLPRLTEGGKYRRWTSPSPSVGRLEGMLIEAAKLRNPDLRNKNMFKHLTQTVVPGFMRDSRPRSLAADSLAALLGTNCR